jgi:four helix bundle protein
MHGEDGMTNDGAISETKFDLEERTAVFGEQIIGFAKRIPVNPVNSPLISQLVRAGTSVGANYCEADDADSKRDFFFKIGLCRREAREAKHWLRMVVAAEPGLRNDARTLWQEAKELNLIFGAIRRNRE